MGLVTLYGDVFGVKSNLSNVSVRLGFVLRHKGTPYYEYEECTSMIERNNQVKEPPRWDTNRTEPVPSYDNT